jgi:predicted permease
LTVVLVVGAGLFLRTIHALRQIPLGFVEQNVLTGGVILNGSSGPSEAQRAQETGIVQTAYVPLLDRLHAIPGIRVAALSSVLPLRHEMSVIFTSTLDHQVDDPQKPRAEGRIASPGLVEALGIPIVRGRFFTDDDTPASPPVVVINVAFAHKYLSGRDPIGHVLSMSQKGRFAEMRIVGLIGDMKQLDLTEVTKPEVYFPLSQTEPGTPFYGTATAFIQVAIRGAVPADALRTGFDKALHDVSPDAVTTDVKSIHQAVEDSFGSKTLIAWLLGAFGGVAMAIASVGLYGLLSFTVAQRTREIGIRMALGAPQVKIVKLIMLRTSCLVGIGLACGAAVAWFAVRFVRGYIYGIPMHDDATFAIVIFVLALMSFFASWLPARRAAAVDPSLALRAE